MATVTVPEHEERFASEADANERADALNAAMLRAREARPPEDFTSSWDDTWFHSVDSIHGWCVRLYPSPPRLGMQALRDRPQ